jgi:hypothetical protein
MSYDGPNPLPVPAGGTGDSTLTAYAVLCGGTTSTGHVQSLAGVGTTGQVLTSNGASALPTFQAASGGGVTFTGDLGTTSSGSSQTITANPTATTGLAFTTSGSNISLNFNIPSAVIANSNVILGYTNLGGGTTSANNTAIGAFAGQSLTTGNSNTLIGYQSGSNVATGSSNVSVGVANIIGASDTYQTILGAGCGSTGSYNTYIGYAASGSSSGNSASGNSNINIGSVGPNSNGGIIEIGTPGTHTKFFAAGIEGVTVSNKNYVTINTSTGQLGSVASVTSSISLTGDSGGALSGAAFTITGGSTALTFAGSGTTLTLGGILTPANGGTGASSFTAYAPICGGTTSTGNHQSASTGISTSGNVLISQGSSALPKFVATTSVGSWVLIQSQTASSSAAITFTTGITSTYNTYALVCSNVLAVATSNTLLVQVSTNGGSSYISTGYLSGINSSLYNNATFTNTNSTAGFLLMNALQTSGPGGSGIYYLQNMTSGAGYPTIVGDAAYATASPWVKANVGGLYNVSSTTVNAFQVVLTTTSILQGTFTLYGILE